MFKMRWVKYSEVIFKLCKYYFYFEVKKKWNKMKFGQMLYVVIKMMVNNKIIED